MHIITSFIDRAILDLKVSRDRLTRYRNKTNLDSEKLLSKAKLYKIQNQKSTALSLLKLRKLKEKEVDKINEQLLNIQTMISNIQTKEQEKEMIYALREGKNALKKLHEENSLEDVLKLMDEVEEQNDIQRQMDDILNQTGERLTEYEEEELEQELLSIMSGEDAMEDTAISMPEVPRERLPTLDIPQELPSKKVQEGKVAVLS